MTTAVSQEPRTFKRRFERLTDAQLLTIISAGIFFLMYMLAVRFMPASVRFDKPQVFIDILGINAYLIVIACALTIVMIGGGINISVGGVICLTCMSCSIFLNESGIENPALLLITTFLIAIGIGAAFGAFQGAIISYLEIQPFIITLAGMFLARGLTTMLSSTGVDVPNSNPFTILSEAEITIPWLGSLTKKGKWDPCEIEAGALVAIGVVIVIFLVMRFTKFGRNTYAIGGNQQSAKMLGINVKRTRFNTYLLSGILSGLAGFLFMMHNGAAGKTGIGLRSEMDAIAASIIGGTLLTGGVGNVIGTFFGVMILATIQKIIGLSPLNESWWQDMANGVLLGMFIVLQSVVLSIRGRGRISLPPWLRIARNNDNSDSQMNTDVKK